MEEVKDVIKGVISDMLKREKSLHFQEAEAVWQRVAGPKASRHNKIVHLTKERIRVNVDSSAWLYELNLKKEQIEHKLQKALKIHEVRFRIGSIKS